MSTAIQGFAGQYMERRRMWRVSVSRTKSHESSVSVTGAGLTSRLYGDTLKPYSKMQSSCRTLNRKESGCIYVNQSVSIWVEPDEPERRYCDCCDCSCYDEGMSLD